jgi:hypothetical protein
MMIIKKSKRIPFIFNPLNAELNSTCHLLALLGAHHILHVSRIRVNDESTRLYICLRLDLYMSHVKKYNRYA